MEYPLQRLSGRTPRMRKIGVFIGKRPRPAPGSSSTAYHPTPLTRTSVSFRNPGGRDISGRSLFLKMPWVFTWGKSEADIAPATLSCFLNFYRDCARVASPRTKRAHSRLRTHGAHLVRTTERFNGGRPWAGLSKLRMSRNARCYADGGRSRRRRCKAGAAEAFRFPALLETSHHSSSRSGKSGRTASPASGGPAVASLGTRQRHSIQAAPSVPRMAKAHGTTSVHPLGIVFGSTSTLAP